MNITFSDKKLEKVVNNDKKLLKEFGHLRAAKSDLGSYNSMMRLHWKM